jgi:hypothetical protein
MARSRDAINAASERFLVVDINKSFFLCLVRIPEQERKRSLQRKVPSFPSNQHCILVRIVLTFNNQSNAVQFLIPLLVLPAGLNAIEATKLCRKLEDDLQFIVQHYAPVVTKVDGEDRLSRNQICGAWVEILPLLARTRRSDQPLVSAIRTLAIALRHHDLNGDAFQPQILEMYCESLRQVGNALAEAKDVFHLEDCAAVMCLAATDVGLSV